MSWTTPALIATLATAVVGSTVAVSASAARDDYTFFDPIVEVRAMLEGLYVENPDDETLQIGAINGMIETLADPYTVFVPHDDTADFSKQLTGQYVGIGAEVQMRDGWLTIASPLDDSPSWNAGVMADDRVTHIDGESTFGLTTEQCIERLMGDPGTKVTITVERPDETLDIEITRDRIVVRPVKGFARADAGQGDWRYLIDPSRGIAYVRLAQFTPDCAQAVREAIETAKTNASNELGGLVLDLRYNPGGVLDEAVQIADMFLDEGVIVSTTGRAGEDRVERATPATPFADLPLVVLINGQSASASEVLAGALRDQERATVLGTRSFGKGLVQTVRPLPSGAGVLKITQQRYALPSGRYIQRDDDSATWGVDPSAGFFLPLSNEETRAMLIARREQEVIARHDDADVAAADEALTLLEDPQLTAAVTTLQSKIDNGTLTPAGIGQDTESAVAAAELATIRRQRDRILRELTRIDRRLDAAQSATPEDARADDRDFWPDETPVVGGTVTVTDADGNTIATLSITEPTIERWLADAGVEPLESPQIPDDDAPNP